MQSYVISLNLQRQNFEIMKRHILVAAFLLFAMTAAFAQDYNRTDSKGRRQGLWMGYHPNGQKRYEGQFKNDKPKGLFNYYDEKGNLQATNTFDKSGVKASNKTYSPEGTLVAEGNYVNQKKDGEWRYYDKAGKLILVEDNKNGQVEGWSRIYNPETGTLAEETQFVNGLPNGVCKKYRENGLLMMECNYSNGKLDGPSKTYYPNTSLKEEGNYCQGEKCGQWKTYNEDGDMVATDSYDVFKTEE